MTILHKVVNKPSQLTDHNKSTTWLHTNKSRRWEENYKIFRRGPNLRRQFRGPEAWVGTGCLVDKRWEDMGAMFKGFVAEKWR